jgi:predicted  nucleic acid-binding Zn-ribbon protein
MRETLDLLMSDNSPLSKMDTGTKEAKDNLTQWYDEVKKYQNDVAEHFRHQKEANLLETRKAEREKSLALFEEQLKQTSGQAEERNKDVDTAREMLDAWRRWAEAAGRIAGLRAKVSSREASIRQATSDKRDLKQVNSDITKLERQKDEYIGKINALNKEMTDINDDMSSNAQAATRLEKFYRDMQEKYIEELKLGERKKTLKEKEKSLKKEMDNVRDRLSFVSPHQ